MDLKFDKNKSIQSLIDEPKTLIITREENLSFQSVSPFLIKHIVRGVIDGDPNKCIKLRNGSLLVETKNLKQANKLIKLISFGSSMSVQVNESASNNSKGIFFNYGLLQLSDELIMEELKSQNVINIKRFTKKVDGTTVDSGIFLITFSTSQLPEYVHLGYEKSSIRPYIPRPLQCSNCFKYFHHSNNCKSDKRCINCGEKYHLQKEGEKCDRTTSCVNCKSQHIPYFKECPTLKKNKEIQAIKVIQRVSMREAKFAYQRTHPTENSYSSVVRRNCNCVCNCETSNTTQNDDHNIIESNDNRIYPSTSSSDREVLETSNIFDSAMEYEENLIDEEETNRGPSKTRDPKPINILKRDNSIIFPRNMSNREKRKLKLNEKKDTKRQTLESKRDLKSSSPDTS